MYGASKCIFYLSRAFVYSISNYLKLILVSRMIALCIFLVCFSLNCFADQYKAPLCRKTKVPSKTGICLVDISSLPWVSRIQIKRKLSVTPYPILYDCFTLRQFLGKINF